MAKLIDLSQTIEDNMPVYPGDIRTSLFQTNYLSANKFNNHRLEISMHSGTHIDSPMHLSDSKDYMSDFELDSFFATGCLLDVRNQPVIKMKAEYESLIEQSSIVLLYTGFDKLYGSASYYEDYPVVDQGLAAFLIERHIKMLGMDTPSPDKYPFEIHKLLFKNKIFVMENLTNLEKLIGVGNFEVIAFPLKIKADSSAIRAVAKINGFVTNCSNESNMCLNK